MYKKTVILIVILIITQLAFARLPRRAFLGTRLLAMNDSLAAASGMKERGGVYVMEVIAGGTGEQMGMKAGDVVLSVNGTRVNSPGELVALVGAMQQGDSVAAAIVRNAAPLLLKGTMEPMPLPVPEYGEIVCGAVPFDGGHVRTFLHKPPGQGKFPAVFVIQGYSCYPVENPGNPAYQHIIGGLVQKGYAVVTTEKACAGDSRNAQPCRDYDLWKEVDLFSASYNALPGYDFIDTANVFIFGHSMGGIQAPLLKTAFPPKAIAVYGTVVRPWFEYLTEQARMQDLLVEGDYLANEQNHQTAVRFYYRFMIEKLPPAELAKEEEFRQLLLSSWDCDGTDYMNGRHYTFWQQLQDTRLFKAWSETPARVFSIWGEGDFVAFNPYEHQLIADIVNRYHPGRAEFIRLPNTNHNFTRVNSREHAIRVRSDYNYHYQNFNPAVIELLHECFSLGAP